MSAFEPPKGFAKSATMKMRVPAKMPVKDLARRARVMRRGSDKLIAVAGLLTGLAFLLLWWPMGIVLILCAAIASNRFRCSSCMNRVDRHAKLCPICRAQFQ